MDDAEKELAPTDTVELISDGEHLLVLGENRRSVEGLLRSKGLLLGKARLTVVRRPARGSEALRKLTLSNPGSLGIRAGWSLMDRLGHERAFLR